MLWLNLLALEALVFEVTSEMYDDISKSSAGSFMYLTRNKVSWSSNREEVKQY